MMKKKQILIPCTALFVLTETVLGYLIQRTPSWIPSGVLSVASILLALVYVAASFEKTAFHIKMLVALTATLAADILLAQLFSFAGEKFAAMCFFTVVQVSYFLRLYSNHRAKWAKIVHLSVRGGAVVLAILLSILVLREKTNALSLIALFYYANLIVNLVFAFIQVRRSVLFPLGLLFFILCDTVIGLAEMSAMYISIREGTFLWSIIHSGLNLGWVFYVPAQTLLAVSVNEQYFKKRKNKKPCGEK